MQKNDKKTFPAAQTYRFFKDTQCHFNSKFVYEANRNPLNVFCVFCLPLRFFFSFEKYSSWKLFEEEKKFLEREWSADVIVHFSRFKNRLCSASFLFLWTWTHIYFGIALLLFTLDSIFTLDVEDIAMVFLLYLYRL